MAHATSSADSHFSGHFGLNVQGRADDSVGNIPHAAENSRPLRFLVADDDRVNRRVAALLLAHQGHLVRTATNGTDAVNMVVRESFDCVLMDVHMPGVDGLDATRRIRERERQTGGHLPILAMTADTLPADRARCREAGMDDCVNKPLDAKEAVAAALRVIGLGHNVGGDNSTEMPAAAPARAHFARTGRMPVAELRRQHDLVMSAAGVRNVLDRIPQPVVVIGSYRQIIYLNPAASQVIPDALEVVVGRRPGEALHCLHSTETTGGCGTTRFCTTCGAAKALRAGQRGEAASEECRIASKTPGEDRDLRVWAAPITVAGELFTLFTIADISDEKRRQALERVFFHDILNIAGGIQGMAALCREATAVERLALSKTVAQLAQTLVEELRAQQSLAAAEDGELHVSPQELSSAAVIEEAIDRYRAHEVARGRSLAIDGGSANVRFVGDGTLLGRVIGNMTKNALEACPPGGVVTIGCRVDDRHIEFRVHNPALMPKNVQLQMFQRSFSTKGPGRGLGTYSMRLLSERYLGGTVSFTSSAGFGTTFVARYPIAGPAPLSG